MVVIMMILSIVVLMSETFNKFVEQLAGELSSISWRTNQQTEQPIQATSSLALVSACQEILEQVRRWVAVHHEPGSDKGWWTMMNHHHSQPSLVTINKHLLTTMKHFQLSWAIGLASLSIINYHEALINNHYASFSIIKNWNWLGGFPCSGINPRRMVVPAITDLDMDTFDEKKDSQAGSAGSVEARTKLERWL